MHYSKGDRVTARRHLTGINVPDVPAGAEGTVAALSLFGKPCRVTFDLQTEWGPKHFDVAVGAEDVE